LNNEGQECKSDHVNVRVIVGGGEKMKRVKEREYS
jgi:hypothetical protein